MRTRRWIGWGIVLVIAVGSVVAAVVLHNRAESDYHRSQANLANRAAKQAEATVNLSVGQLATEAAFFEASQTVSRSEYRVFTRPLLAHSAISATVFTRRIESSARPSFEHRLGVTIVDAAAGGFRRAASRPEYFPITYDSVEKGATSPRVGFDLGGDPVQGTALRAARDTGAAAATPLVPVRAVGATGVSVYQPIFRSGSPRDTRAERRSAIMGFAGGVFRDSDIARAALAGTPEDVSVQVLENGTPVIGPAGLLNGGATAAIQIADRRWTLVLLDPSKPSSLGSIVLAVAGLLLAAMLAVLLVTWDRRERYALSMVNERIAERDRAEVERQRSARQYQLLAENATDVITVQDTRGVFLYISPSAETVLGWTPEEMTGTNAYDLVHPDDVEDTLAKTKPLVVPGTTLRHQYRLRTKAGTYTWVETTARSVSGDSGSIEIHGATRDIARRKEMEEELKRLAHEDSLTGLQNRRRFEEELDGEMARTRRDDGEGAVLLIDLDDFKEVNDTYGHGAGDAVLVEVAALLRGRLRETDVIGRLGGDEFAVILRGSDERDARLAAESIAKALREHRSKPAGGTRLGGSVGVALFGSDPRTTVETIMAEADIAMYAAKEDGRDRVRVYDMTRDSHEGRAQRPGLRDD